ncbi:MAG: hypothetical protein HKO80_03230 [Flavobacteriaceae bacterium]|nr:hypothetical protein [Flavobacteriaceae bacterium]
MMIVILKSVLTLGQIQPLYSTRDLDEIICSELGSMLSQKKASRYMEAFF